MGITYEQAMAELATRSWTTQELLDWIQQVDKTPPDGALYPSLALHARKEPGDVCLLFFEF